jgi:hypothetical protein
MKISHVARFVLCVVLALPLLVQSAHAEEYVDPTWPNLVRTLVRYNAINLTDMTLLDEYAAITDCDLYKAFYHDDFKWHEVQQAMVKSIEINSPTFPIRYRYNVDLQLDRYDFKSQLYHLTEKTTLRNVNMFRLYSVVGSNCGDADVEYMPHTFHAVLDSPFYLDSLPLAEKDAQSLLKLMDADKNFDHIIYASFNIRVTYIQPLRKETTGKGVEMVTHYVQPDAVQLFAVRMDSKLESVNFYEDPQRTKLVYQFQP